MVFQSYALWPHMSIADNLRHAAEDPQGGKAERPPGSTRPWTRSASPTSPTATRTSCPAASSSARAGPRAGLLAASVLLDEPLSNLDAKLREQARAWLKRLQADLGITTVYVTHDQDEALALSDRIAVMSEGEMVQIGTPREIYEEPATAAVAASWACNFLRRGRRPVRPEVTVGWTQRRRGAGAERPRRRPRQQVTLGVRPERLEVLPVDQTPPAGSSTVNADV